MRPVGWHGSTVALRFAGFRPDQLGQLPLGRLPLELGFQTMHLVFEAQLQLLQPHFL
jgi:hypothetical protein